MHTHTHITSSVVICSQRYRMHVPWSSGSTGRKIMVPFVPPCRYNALCTGNQLCSIFMSVFTIQYMMSSSSTLCDDDLRLRVRYLKMAIIQRVFDVASLTITRLLLLHWRIPNRFFTFCSCDKRWRRRLKTSLFGGAEFKASYRHQNAAPDVPLMTNFIIRWWWCHNSSYKHLKTLLQTSGNCLRPKRGCQPRGSLSNLDRLLYMSSQRPQTRTGCNLNTAIFFSSFCNKPFFFCLCCRCCCWMMGVLRIREINSLARRPYHAYCSSDSRAAGG